MLIKDMRRFLAYLLVVGCLFAMAGCGTVSDENIDPTGNTVENPFVETTVAADAAPPATEEEWPAAQSISQISSWSLPEYLLDDVGHYVSYSGGEMHLTYFFEYKGTALAEYGVAIMIFLDGQLQPFRTDKDDTLRYVHILYPPECGQTERITLDLIFTPIAGSQGDVMDLSVLSKQYPDWRWGDGALGESGYTSSLTTRLKFAATPPEAERPESQCRVLEWNCSYVDATLAEVKSWTADTLGNINSCIRIDGEGYTRIDGASGKWDRCSLTVTPDVPMEMTIEIVNTSGVEYGVIIFVDNEPISTDPRDTVFIDAASGQKAVLSLQIDMTDFDTQSKVYAIVVPRNYLSTKGYTASVVVDLTDTFEYYLFSGTSLPE